MRTYRFAGDGRLDDLYNKLVDHKAPTVAGEIVRATAEICSRWNCDGQKLGTGYGWQTCNPAADYIINHADRTTGYFLIRLTYEAPEMGEEAYNRKLNDAYDAILFFLERHPELQKARTNLYTDKN